MTLLSYMLGRAVKIGHSLRLSPPRMGYLVNQLNLAHLLVSLRNLNLVRPTMVGGLNRLLT